MPALISSLVSAALYEWMVQGVLEEIHSARRQMQEGWGGDASALHDDGYGIWWDEDEASDRVEAEAWLQGNPPRSM